MSHGESESALVFAQERFNELYKSRRHQQELVQRDLQRHKVIAYGLKAIAVFGGLAIAVGLTGALSQAIGIAISVAVAYDAVASNHKRLMSRSTADLAYRRLLEGVRHKHTNGLQAALSVKKKSAGFSWGI